MCDLLMLLLRFVLALSLGTYHLSLNNAAASSPASPRPIQSGPSVLRDGVTVRAALKILESVASSEDMHEIRSVLATVNLKDDAVLPRATTDSRGLRFEGDDVHYDLERLSRGEVFDGHRFWRHQTGSSWSKNYTRLVRYLMESKPKVAWYDLAVPKAYAQIDDPWDPDVLRKNAATAERAVARGLHLLTSIVLVKMVVSLQNSAGLSSLTFLGGYAGILAAATVLYLIFDSVITAINRHEKYGGVECRAGHIVITMGDREERIESKFRDLKLSTSDQIGIAELKLRQILCEHPRALGELNSMINAGDVTTAPDGTQTKTSR